MPGAPLRRGAPNRYLASLRLPRRFLFLLLLFPPVLHLAACGADEPGESGAGGPAPVDPRTTDPARFFSDLEERLLGPGETRLAFRIFADGAVAAELEGELSLGEEDALELHAEGLFGDEPVTLTLSVSDGRMRGGSGSGTFDEPAAPGVREAVVLGLTRMGLLHNLARLVAGRPPDHADGGVSAWVRGAGFAWTADSQAGSRVGISFGILVDEQPVADAVLWFDPAGQTLVRDQTVRFPGGEMRVRERYEVR